LRRLIREDVELDGQLTPHLGLVMRTPTRFAGHSESGHQCRGTRCPTEADSNRHGPRRNGPDRHRHLPGRRSGFGMSVEHSAIPEWDDRGGRRNIFEPFFTTKGTREGDGAGAVDGRRHRETEWALHRSRQRTGRGTTFRNLPAQSWRTRLPIRKAGSRSRHARK